MKEFLNDMDIIVITETHFGVRTRCPELFEIICRSKPLESKKPRGGVAIYKKKSLQIQLDVICSEFRDCVVVRIRNTDMVIAGMYIPPENSHFYNDIYFDNLQMLMNHFHDRQLLIMGDLNSRVGDTKNSEKDLNYHKNPDIAINKHGRTLTIF